MSLPAVTWLDDDAAVQLVDQTLLPGTTRLLQLRSVAELVDAVQRLVVRGAPALGAVGALGVVLALDEAKRQGWDAQRLDEAVDSLRRARPTAVNLAWGVDQVRPLISAGRDAVLAAARDIVAADIAANQTLSRLGADWILQQPGPAGGWGETGRPLRVLTHCNTGALATTGWGTALGIIRELHQRGRLELVVADETRPLLQGSRLTAWELAQEGIPYRVQVDGAAASTILRGLVDVAVIGADRIAANGDTANKIGSLGVALACAAAGIPFVVAAPWSTVDLATPDGSTIEVEERAADEVLRFAGTLVAPEGSAVLNPAFDVTPARYVSAIVTEQGVFEPAEGTVLHS